jgi:hypothetical protein
MNEYWYHIYKTNELSTIDWLKFKQQIRWNLNATEFILEYISEPEDKTGVLTQEEARVYTKTEDWEINSY